jgi:hypothetical protein
MSIYLSFIKPTCMKLLKLGMLFLAIAAIGTSCKKAVEAVPVHPLKEFAKNELSGKMSIQNFTDLDWEKASVLGYKTKGVIGIIRIPSRTVANKALYFENTGTVVRQNWTEIQNEKIVDNKVYADIIRTDISNNLIDRFSIDRNKRVTYKGAGAPNVNSVRVHEEVILSGTGGDAVVTGYIKNTTALVTIWYINIFCFGTGNQELFPAGEGGTTTSTVELPEVEPDEPEADTTYWQDGKKFFVATSYTVVLGRAITATFAVNMTTYEVSNFNVTMTGVGVYGLDFSRGIKRAYADDGALGKTLNIDFDVAYILPIIGMVGDIVITREWHIRVPSIDMGYKKVKMF